MVVYVVVLWTDVAKQNAILKSFLATSKLNFHRFIFFNFAIDLPRSSHRIQSVNIVFWIPKLGFEKGF